MGRFLSLVRFLFIAAYPDCFENEIIAEMRGHIEENNKSFFGNPWENISLTWNFNRLIDCP